MPKTKRILVVTRSTVGHTDIGGMETVAHDLLYRLKDAKVEFGLLTTEGVDERKLDGVYKKIWTIPGSRPGKYSLQWWLKSASARSPWHAWQPDLIFSISSAAGSFAIHPAWSHIKVVAQCHGTAWQEVRSSLSTPSLREVAKIPLNLGRIVRERESYARFYKTIAIGPRVVEQLTSPPLSLNKSSIDLIPNAVDNSYWAFCGTSRKNIRSSLDLSLDTPVAIFAGRLHEQKGADLAIRALSRMQDSPWVLVIAGEGPALNDLVSLAQNLGVEKKVIFVGHLDRSRLRDFLSASDLLVFPTRRKEGLPMNVLEALAAGLKVLTVENANVPRDMTSQVIVSELDACVLGEVWKSIRPPADRSSRLSAAYFMASSVGSYNRIFDIV